MNFWEIVTDTCKKGGFPLSEEQTMLVAGSVAVLLEKAAKDEREACVKVCMCQPINLKTRQMFAAAIRARGQE